jgi:hypothetical protein
MRRNTGEAEQSAFCSREKLRVIKKLDEVKGLRTVLDIIATKYILVG